MKTKSIFRTSDKPSKRRAQTISALKKLEEGGGSLCALRVTHSSFIIVVVVGRKEAKGGTKPGIGFLT